ncbi:hypothetical protein V4C53_43560 [Paraburkholderia azotifigens]|uniref:hypothetical protein n=1 Tax=Paraburkholderia azotifigens TaxID=2057004 RepID=UPI00317D55A9
MKPFRYASAFAACLLLLPGQRATAQDNSQQDFTRAALQVEKAHVIEGIYYLTQLLPRQCHDPNVDKAVIDFTSNNQELIERVKGSPLFPMIRDGIEKANAAPKPPTQIESECAKTFAVLRTFDSEQGKANAARMLQTMKKEVATDSN